jgi:adenosylcobyric acid synthase
MSKLFVVGIGPGDLKHMTFEAREAVDNAEVVIGYKTYLDLIKPLLAVKEAISSGMTKEVERCREALCLAASGKRVALVSGGDAGVYGMAGLVLELVGTEPRACQVKGEHTGLPLHDVEIIIIPGVSAVQAAAAVLGAPLMHGFAVISLSDLLTPWDIIERRLAAAAAADYVVALYNPRSKGRTDQLDMAREIFLAARSIFTPVGIVRNACRLGEEKIVTILGAMHTFPVDMYSIVIIGNSTTFLDKDGRMVTPRGYKIKGGLLRAECGVKNHKNNSAFRNRFRTRRDVLRHRLGCGEIGADRRPLPNPEKSRSGGCAVQVPEHGAQLLRHFGGRGDRPSPGGPGPGLRHSPAHGHESSPLETQLRYGEPGHRSG